MTPEIQVIGQVDVNRAGDYEVTYVCSTEEKETRMVKRTIQVVEKTKTKETAQPQETKTPQAVEAEESSSATGETANAGSESVLFPYPYQESAGEEATESEAVLESAQPSEAPHSSKTTEKPAKKNKKDRVPPDINLIATSRMVHDVQYSTLRQRVSVSDNLNQIDDVYITVQPAEVDGYYVVVYEVVDAAGNCCCISENVQIENISFGYNY